jgi:hypothetical protein
MLLKLVLLIPSVGSLALCTYLLAGLFIHFRALYKTAPARKLARAGASHMDSTSSATSIEIDAIPAT